MTQEQTQNPAGKITVTWDDLQSRKVDQRLKESLVGNALFFHARYVAPGWHMRRVAAIGNHIFYR